MWNACDVKERSQWANFVSRGGVRNPEESNNYSADAACTNSEAEWRRGATKSRMIIPEHGYPQIRTNLTDVPSTSWVVVHVAVMVAASLGGVR